MRRLACPDFVPLLLALGVLSSGTASAQIQISFTAPESHRVAQDFELKLNIASANQLDAVQAEFAGQVIPLPVVPRPSALISIAGLAYGEYELTVTARDVLGTEVKATSRYQVDRLPRLVVQAPDVGAVAQPSVHVLASCEDDGPHGCQVRVSARIEKEALGDPRQHTQSPLKLDSPRGVDTEICLSQYVGKRVRLKLSAFDGAQSSEEVQRLVLVNDDARLTQVVSVPGELLDYDDERLLFVDAQRRARVMDRASGNIQTLMEHVNPNAYYYAHTGVAENADSGFLVPGGAVLLSNHQLIPIKDGQLLPLRNDSSYSGYRVAGRFLIYMKRDIGALLYDFVTETATPLRSILPNNSSWVGLDKDGTILWTRGLALWRYRQGQNELLAEAKRSDYFHSRSDGDDVVFNLDKSMVLFRGGQRHVLSDNSSLELAELRGALVNRGWVAFARPGGGVAQVWTRSPTDVEQQVTFLGTDSWPLVLGPDGTVLYTNGGQYHLAVPGAPHMPLFLAQTTLLRVENGAAYMALGGTLFRGAPTPDPGPLTCSADAVVPGQAPPAPPRATGCTAVGGESAWFLLSALLRLGLRRTRRVR